MIRVAGLTVAYGERQVLQHLDFHLGRGELVGLLGPNGSGKSTLLLTLGGVLTPRAGRVELAGEELSSFSARRLARVVASVPQRLGFSFPFTCVEVVLMGRYPHQQGWGGLRSQDLEKITEVMRLTETLHLAHRPITETSGGESQRVVIARALAQDSQVLLMDEATASLDAAHKIKIFDLLREKKHQQVTVLCAMHDLNLAALYCRRLIFLKDGRIVLDGPTRETFTEENLAAVYDTAVRVIRHPDTGAPQAIFVPGKEGAQSRRPDFRNLAGEMDAILSS